MGYYRIKNITDKLPKRHPQKDSILKIEYNIGFKNDSHNLGGGQQITIECGNLPTNIHMLRMKNLITVQEISKNEFYNTNKIQENIINLHNEVVIDDSSSDDEQEKNIKKKNQKKTDE